MYKSVPMKYDYYKSSAYVEHWQIVLKLSTKVELFVFSARYQNMIAENLQLSGYSHQQLSKDDSYYLYWLLFDFFDRVTLVSYIIKHVYLPTMTAVD